MSTDTNAGRRTKRRYAHESFPHAGEYEVRPLAVEVPYLYARFVGFRTEGTGWAAEISAATGDRIGQFLDAAQIALLADALFQGMTGDAAWAWVAERMTDDMEVTWERAATYGIKADDIKPYPCGPAPQHHCHYGPPDARGWRLMTRFETTEDACDECTEPVEVNL